MCFSYEREVLVRQAQHEDRLRRARQRAFKRANHLPYSRFNAFNQQLTHWLGRQLVTWGVRLQRYGSVVNTASTSLHETQLSQH
jgi:hypothetical protein